MGLKLHIDTNAVTAFLRNERATLRIIERAPALALSPIVIGELKAGFALGSRPRENLGLLARLLDSPRVSVPPLDERVTDAYGRIYAQLRARGTPIPTNDLWIAASVGESEEALFSFDPHFEAVAGLRLVRGEAELRAWLG